MGDMFEIPKSMIQTYLVRREKDLQSLVSSLEIGSVDDFRRIGHQILGNARTYGFQELESLGAKMQSLSSENLVTEGPILIQSFQQWLKKTTEKYQ